MKSNQLNAIALLLLATAGLSAVNTQYDAVQKALDIVRTGKGVLEAAESALVNENDKNVHRFVNAIAIAKPENKALLKKQALKMLNQNATFVQRNKARVLRNIVDPIVRNKRTILKAAAALAAVTGTAYAIDRYGFEGKGLQYTKESTAKGVKATKEMASNIYAKGQEYGSWLYNKLPSKPAWFGMPTFISNLFAKKEVTPQAEQPKPEAPVEQPVQPTIAEEPKVDTSKIVENKVENSEQADINHMKKLGLTPDEIAALNFK